jgi:GntR family transcriptional repressor for pyruvate dehydrogenase complex
MPDVPPLETRVQYVMRQVAEHIGRGRMRAGDELPGETSFGEQLGVSRTVVREAFGALSALNIIDTANGRRPRVSALSSRTLSVPLDHALRTEQISLQQVRETRRCLETEIIVLAAQHRSDEEAERILDIAHAMARVERDSPELVRLDIALHKAIAAASRNALMETLLASLEPLLESAVPPTWETRRTEDQHAVVIARHVELAETIRRRDPEAARRVMEAHFDRDSHAPSGARQA